MINLMDFDRDIDDLACFLSDQDLNTISQCEKAIKDNDVLVVLSQVNKIIMGYSSTHVRFREELWIPEESETATFQKNDNAYLDRIVIAKEYRRRGIGRSLIDHTCEVLKEIKKKYLFLHVFADNPNAFNFYNKCNWELIKTIEAEWYNMKKAHVFRKNVST